MVSCLSVFNVNIQEWLGVGYIYNSESQSLSYNGSTVHVAVEKCQFESDQGPNIYTVNEVLQACQFLILHNLLRKCNISVPTCNEVT